VQTPDQRRDVPGDPPAASRRGGPDEERAMHRTRGSGDVIPPVFGLLWGLLLHRAAGLLYRLAASIAE
jgi:hypothetical protein